MREGARQRLYAVGEPPVALLSWEDPLTPCGNDCSPSTTGRRTAEKAETARRREDCTTQQPDDVLAAYRDSVWGFVLRQVGDRSLADDLTQETLLRAERSIGTWRSEASLRSWMYGIAINVVRDHCNYSP